MNREEIKMELDRIEEIGMRAYIDFRVGHGKKGIVIGGEDRSDCVGCRCAWHLDTKSSKLIITENSEYVNGANIESRYSIPISAIISIDDLPF